MTLDRALNQEARSTHIKNKSVSVQSLLVPTSVRYTTDLTGDTSVLNTHSNAFCVQPIMSYLDTGSSMCHRLRVLLRDAAAAALTMSCRKWPLACAGLLLEWCMRYG